MPGTLGTDLRAVCLCLAPTSTACSTPTTPALSEKSPYQFKVDGNLKKMGTALDALRRLFLGDPFLPTAHAHAPPAPHHRGAKISLDASSNKPQYFCPMKKSTIPLTILSVVLSCAALQAFDSFDEAMANAKDKLESKEYPEAETAFKSALEMAANAYQHGEAQIGLMNALLESGDYEVCRKLAVETLEDYKDEPRWPQAHALKIIAESYQLEGRTDEMEKTMQRADSLVFSKPGFMSWLNLAFGCMYYKEKNWDAAKSMYMKAEDGEGAQAWALYWLAQINKAEGQPDKAAERARKVLALKPPAELAELARKLLATLGAPEK